MRCPPQAKKFLAGRGHLSSKSMIFVVAVRLFRRAAGMDIEIFGYDPTSKIQLSLSHPAALPTPDPNMGVTCSKLGSVLNPDPPSPRHAAVIVGSSQKDGTATSPTDGAIFPDMYVTHPLTTTPHDTA